MRKEQLGRDGGLLYTIFKVFIPDDSDVGEERGSDALTFTQSESVDSVLAEASAPPVEPAEPRV